MNGFKLLENFTVYFLTDVYCGFPSKYDLVMFLENILIDHSKVFYFFYVKNENGTISLFKRISNPENDSDRLGKKMYDLIKN